MSDVSPYDLAVAHLFSSLLEAQDAAPVRSVRIAVLPKLTKVP